MDESHAALIDSLPRYRCHKIVKALEVDGIGDLGHEGALLRFRDERYGYLTVPFEWVTRHLKPGERHLKPGETKGYYVVYEDGYTSWSPVDVFEAGYVPIQPKLAEMVENPLTHYEQVQMAAELALARDAAVNDTPVAIITVATPQGIVISQHLLVGEDGTPVTAAEQIVKSIIQALTAAKAAMQGRR